MGIEALVGLIMPVVIEFLAKWVKSTNGKFLVSLILPLLAGAAISWQQLSVVDVEAILASGAVIFAAAQAVYKLYFRDSSLQKKIARI